MGRTVFKEGEGMVNKRADRKKVEDIIINHIKKNKRALSATLFVVVQSYNRNISRQSIGRVISAMVREERIKVHKKLGNDELYVLV